MIILFHLETYNWFDFGSDGNWLDLVGFADAVVVIVFAAASAG